MTYRETRWLGRDGKFRRAVLEMLRSGPMHIQEIAVRMRARVNNTCGRCREYVASGLIVRVAYGVYGLPGAVAPARVPRPRSGISVAQRFFRHVAKGPDHWMWTAGRFSKGYRHGFFCVDLRKRRYVTAKRAMYLINGYEIAPKHVVVGTCQEVLCVRPEHLAVMTLSASLRRMHRQRIELGQRRLTVQDIQDIRHARRIGEKRAIVAARYGISDNLVGDIAHRRAYRSVQ